MCFRMADSCNIQSHYNYRRQEKFEAGIYFKTPRENISYCSPVGNTAFFDSHHNAITAFLGSLVSNWNMALKNWNTTRESEDGVRKTRMTRLGRPKPHTDPLKVNRLNWT